MSCQRGMELGDFTANRRAEAASRPLIVAHPDELLAEAVDRMVRHEVGRLLVVDPSRPSRLLGYLGRTGIADALGELSDEEELREAGWVTARARLLRRQVRQLLRRRSALRDFR